MMDDSAYLFGHFNDRKENTNKQSQKFGKNYYKISTIILLK